MVNCYKNRITELDNLPVTLIKLDYYRNPLKYNCEPTLENIRNYNSQTARY